MQMSEAGMSPERIVSLVNYDELIEASSESWMALLEAIDNSATAPEGADDQVIRDMYAMLAADSADGATPRGWAIFTGRSAGMTRRPSRPRSRPSTARHRKHTVPRRHRSVKTEKRRGGVTAPALLFRCAAQFQRGGYAFESFRQLRTRTGKIDPLKTVALTVRAEHGTVVGSDLCFAQHEVPELFGVHAAAAEIQPRQIRSLRYRVFHARHAGQR